MIARPAQSGFSLVELSIVLVILGLLTGGILAGQSLIRAAELRSVATESSRYVAAVRSFQDRYFALPGDMTNAVSFWGSAGGSGNDDACYAVIRSGQPTCNGNGDGRIQASGSTTRPEMFGAWQHLANAGLVEGSYTGVAGPGGWEHSVFGTNTPKSKLGNAGWSLEAIGTMSGSGSYFDGSYGNPLFIGSQTSGGVGYGAVLKPEEAWNVDTKLDDGRPAFGSITNFKFQSPGCSTTTVSSTAEYALSSAAIACGLVIKTGF